MQGAAKGHRRYRYYVSRKLVRSGPEDAEHGWRLSAPEVERSVSAAARQILADRDAIAQAVEESGSDAHRLPAVLKSAQAWSERLRTKREAAAALADLIERTDLSRDGIRVTLKVPIPPAEEQKGAPPRHIVLTRFVPMQMKRRGVEMRMVLEGDSNARPGRSASAQSGRPRAPVVSGSDRGPRAVGLRDSKAGRTRSPLRASAAPARISVAADRRGDRRRPPAA